MASLFKPQLVNSTTYADVVALTMGLARIPGESSANFLDRLYTAAGSRRDHSFEGTVNEIAFQLGLSSYFGISISSSDPSTIFQVYAGSVVITNAAGSVTIPTITTAPDNYWKWLFLSEVVAQINAKTNVQANLIAEDKPAYVLLAQSSLNYSIAEKTSDASNFLKHSNIVVGMERFNVSVPNYSLSAEGILNFSSAPPANTQISYTYNLLPYNVTCSDVALMNLLDPNIQNIAKGFDGGLVHQMSEYVQDILTQDPCYWGR